MVMLCFRKWPEESFLLLGGYLEGQDLFITSEYEKIFLTARAWPRNLRDFCTVDLKGDQENTRGSKRKRNPNPLVVRSEHRRRLEARLPLCPFEKCINRLQEGVLLV